VFLLLSLLLPDPSEDLERRCCRCGGLLLLLLRLRFDRALATGGFSCRFIRLNTRPDSTAAAAESV
jgi:hypothetical protein